jgi:hypothetical protein
MQHFAARGKKSDAKKKTELTNNINVVAACKLEFTKTMQNMCGKKERSSANKLVIAQ